MKMIDVRIFPMRLLSPTTVEKLLNKIYNLNGIIRIMVHGPSIPEKIYYGPAKGLKVDHTDRKVIKIRGKPIELRVKVGEVIVTISEEKFEENLEKLDEITKGTLKCQYKILIGSFTKKDVTVSDYIKYGSNFENKLDKRLVGLADPNTKLEEAVTNIK